MIKNSFPKILTIEEERKYYKEFLNGSIEAKNILIEKNMKLVKHIVKKYSCYEADEIISIATMGLVKGIISFNENKNITLSKYIAKCIENEILTNINVLNKKQNYSRKIKLKTQLKILYTKIRFLLKNRQEKVVKLKYNLLYNTEITPREVGELLRNLELKKRY